MKKITIATLSFERRRKIMKRLTFTLSFPLIAVLTLLMIVCPVAMAAQETGSPTHPNHPAAQTVKMTDADAENIVRRTIQYVALYDTLLNFTFNKKNPFASGGWNQTHYPEGLMDASVRAIPRPNNDTLYVLSLLDLRKEPVIIHYPGFESKFVSLETSSMDHYVNMPLATSKGDFKKPTSILYYSARTEGYKGEAVKGVDKIMEMSGDFVCAFLRVMPEATDPAKFKANMAAISKVKLQTLSELQGKPRKAADKTIFPPFGKSEDTYAKQFLSVMQFVFNHTTFDPKNEMDQKALAALAPLGVKPGKTYHASQHGEIDGEQLGKVFGEINKEQNALWNEPKKVAPFLTTHQAIPAQGAHGHRRHGAAVVCRPYGSASRPGGVSRHRDDRRQADERAARLRDPHDQGRSTSRQGLLVRHAL